MMKIRQKLLQNKTSLGGKQLWEKAQTPPIWISSTKKNMTRTVSHFPHSALKRVQSQSLLMRPLLCRKLKVKSSVRKSKLHFKSKLRKRRFVKTKK